MGQFNHPSIVKLYGVVLKEEPVSYSCHVSDHGTENCFLFCRL